MVEGKCGWVVEKDGGRKNCVRMGWEMFQKRKTVQVKLLGGEG